MTEKFATVTGAGGKTGDDWDNAYDETQLQTGINACSSAGSHFWIEEGTYTISTSLLAAASGSAASHIWCLIGVNSAHVEDGTMPIINGNSTATYCFSNPSGYNYNGIRNITFIGATNRGWRAVGRCFAWHLYNVESSNHGSDGFNFDSNSPYASLSHLKASGNATQGFTGGASNPVTSIYESVAINNGANGFESMYLVKTALAHNNVTSGFTNAISVTDVTSDGNGVGIAIAGGVAGHIENSRITRNTTGLSCASSTIEDQNYFYLNGTKKSGAGELVSLGRSIDGDADGYTDRANDNFTLTAGASGVGVENPMGVLTETVNLYHPTYGLSPAAGAGGPASSLINGGLLN